MALLFSFENFPMKISKPIILSLLATINATSAGIQRIIAGNTIDEAYRLGFIEWITNNMRIISGDKDTDSDFFNVLRVLTKDNIYTKGKLLDNNALDFISKAEEATFSCDKKYRKPIHVPGFLLRIKTLRSLFLKNMAITETAARITTLTNLETLELHSCTIHDLTCLLPVNSKLKKLIIHDSNIKICMLDPAKVPNLEELVINNSNLYSLNKEAFTLGKLKKLNLAGNHIFNLPIFQDSDKTVFEELDFSRNKFQVFPSGFNLFKSMKKFNISNNVIEQFEKDFKFGKDMCLEELNMKSNAIKSIPGGIINLTKLKTLDASSNQLESVDSDIFRLPNIEKIILAYNRFVDMGESFNFLTRRMMKHASAADAPLNLKEIDLSYNFLTSLPASTVLFENIKKINLKGNLFTTVPYELLDLKKLESINISTNRLTYVPAGLANLPYLYDLDLSGGNDFRTPIGNTNVIKGLPKKILNRGSKKVITIKLKGNPLRQESTKNEYGKAALEEYYSDWVSV